jgi:phosphate:Na+ symporter
VNNFERVADHCSNIAVAVIEASDTHLQSHDYLRNLKNADHEDYRNQLTAYADKYYSRLDATL